MTTQRKIAAALVVLTAVPVSAQEFGGSINAEYRNFNGDDYDGNSATIDAGGDVNLGNNIGLGANFSLGQDSEDFDYLNGTVHGYYLFSPTAAVGLFAASDSTEASDTTIYGIEVGGRTQRAHYEVFYGVTDVEDPLDGNDLTIFGASFEFDINNGFALGLQYDSFTGLPGVSTTGQILEDTTFTDIAVLLRYDITPEASIYAEYGSLGQSAFEDGVSFTSDLDADYFSISAEFALGGNGGNIFGARTFSGFGL